MEKLKRCPVCHQNKLATGENVAAKFFCLNKECRSWTADGANWETPPKLPAPPVMN